MTTFKRVCDFLYGLSRVCLILIGGGLVFIISLGVVTRYVFKAPLEWEYELAIMLFVWGTFLGAATAFRDGHHISFNILLEYLPQKARYVVLSFKNFVEAIILLSGIFGGIYVVRTTVNVMFQTLPLNLAFTYAALPVGFALMFVFLLEKTI